MIKNKTILISLIFILVICSTSFAAVPKVEKLPALPVKKAVPIQSKYDSLPETVPSYIIINTSGTSSISQELLSFFQDKVNKVLVNSEKIKPVSLNKWLIEQYGEKKSPNINDFVKTLSQELYPVTISGLCHPYIFEVSDGYVLMISFYRFTDNGYPFITFRKVSSYNEFDYAIQTMLDEFLNILNKEKDQSYNKKKIIIKPFVLECRKYTGQSTGDFDYIPSPFIEQDGVLIQSDDDFFSRSLAYSLNITQMVNSVSCLDIEQYVKRDFNTCSFADFYIEGRIQLTDQINIYHISLFNAKTNEKIKEIKYFSSDFSLEGIWNANTNIVYSLADYIFGVGNYGVCPDIYTPGQGLFLNDMFIGWDAIEKQVLPKGKHIIYTGDYFQIDSTLIVRNKNKAVDINGNVYRSFFLYLDDKNWLFRGKDGERVWNLMEK